MGALRGEGMTLHGGLVIHGKSIPVDSGAFDNNDGGVVVTKSKRKRHEPTLLSQTVSVGPNEENGVNFPTVSKNLNMVGSGCQAHQKI